MIIRETKDIDLNNILFVERKAFKSNKEADITKEMLTDPTAKPLLSLMAMDGNQAVGHILFTAAHITNNPKKAKISFLAPLAIIPNYQKQGIGGKLIIKGLEILTKAGVDLVFVLGHPKYYPKYGFTPASRLGIETTYPIPKEAADAWMVHVLNPKVIGTISGKVICCDSLNKPELWKE